MGKSSATRARVWLDMTTQLFPSTPEETDPRMLEALASLNQISNAINRIGSEDADQNDLSLQLIVDSARINPRAAPRRTVSAVITPGGAQKAIARKKDERKSDISFMGKAEGRPRPFNSSL